MLKEEHCDGCCYRRTCVKDLEKCCYLVKHECILVDGVVMPKNSK